MVTEASNDWLCIQLLPWQQTKRTQGLKPVSELVSGLMSQLTVVFKLASELV